MKKKKKKKKRQDSEKTSELQHKGTRNVGEQPKRPMMEAQLQRRPKSASVEQNYSETQTLQKHNVEKRMCVTMTWAGKKKKCQ